VEKASRFTAVRLFSFVRAQPLTGPHEPGSLSFTHVGVWIDVDMPIGFNLPHLVGRADASGVALRRDVPVEPEWKSASSHVKDVRSSMSLLSQRRLPHGPSPIATLARMSVLCRESAPPFLVV